MQGVRYVDGALNPVDYLGRWQAGRSAWELVVGVAAKARVYASRLGLVTPMRTKIAPPPPPLLGMVRWWLQRHGGFPPEYCMWQQCDSLICLSSFDACVGVGQGGVRQCSRAGCTSKIEASNTLSLASEGDLIRALLDQMSMGPCIRGSMCTPPPPPPLII